MRRGRMYIHNRLWRKGQAAWAMGLPLVGKEDHTQKEENALYWNTQYHCCFSLILFSVGRKSVSLVGWGGWQGDKMQYNSHFHPLTPA